VSVEGERKHALRGIAVHQRRAGSCRARLSAFSSVPPKPSLPVAHWPIPQR
jgi:hypothetical protein